MPVRKRFGQHFLHDPGVIRRIIDAVAPASRRAHRRNRPRPRRIDLGAAAARSSAWTSSRSIATWRGAASRSARAETDFACTSRTCCTPISALARHGRTAARRRQPAVQHFHAAAVSAADAARRHRGHVFHAAKGSRGSHDRAAGEPRTYGRLTVMLAAVAEVEKLFDVGPGAFQPRPKVWSAIVRLRPTAQAALRHRRGRRAAHCWSRRRFRIGAKPCAIRLKGLLDAGGN